MHLLTELATKNSLFFFFQYFYTFRITLVTFLQKYCQFHLAPEYHSNNCGPSYEDGVDAPQILIVRYLRNSTDDNTKTDRWKHFRNQYLGDTNVASQLIARYPGPEDVEEVFAFSLNYIRSFCHFVHPQQTKMKLSSLIIPL